ncbi:MAG: cation:proton antiporter [Desulfobacteraceae bacterium]|jgi:Kef-type K+ transport system membrane component KefB
MPERAQTFITLGILFLLGLLTDAIGRKTRLPRVTLLLIFGFAIGPGGLGFLTPKDGKWFSVVADMALIMIGFLLGEKLTLSSLRRHGRLVLGLSAAEAILTALVVLAGLLLIGVQLDIALLLAGIAPATDPAATTDVVFETKADGKFSRTLLGIVAVDDAWGLIVFSLMLTAAQAFSGRADILAPLMTGAWEIGGALLVGIVLGIPMAYLTGRVRAGEPTLVEALGVVFLCGGIAIWLEVSFLLASMVLGCIIANFARHHTRPFHAIELIDLPFMILFFVLAGASLETEMLSNIGLVGSAYVVLRVVGRFVGAWAGGAIGRAESLFSRWMGAALLPQAGVALGMALVATQRRPDLGEVILTVVVTSTVLFEIIGPVLTRIALVRMGEVPRG